VLSRLAEGDYGGSAIALSRFFFVLGQVALQNLVHIEVTASLVRKQRMAAEKQAAEISAQRAMAGQSGQHAHPPTPSSHLIAVQLAKG
jgi:hypothetical protein